MHLNSSSEIKELAAALLAFQGEVKSVPKESTNPFHKSKYADLPTIWEHVRPLLTANGLVLVNTMVTQPGGFTGLLTTLVHAPSGQWISGEMPLYMKTQDPQGQGSAITYARRYSMSAILGIVTDEDDDGEAAMARKPGKEIPKSTWEKPKGKEVSEKVMKEDEQRDWKKPAKQPSLDFDLGNDGYIELYRALKEGYQSKQELRGLLDREKLSADLDTPGKTASVEVLNALLRARGVQLLESSTSGTGKGEVKGLDAGVFQQVMELITTR